jgi:hypothetical protein
MAIGPEVQASRPCLITVLPAIVATVAPQTTSLR